MVITDDHYLVVYKHSPAKSIYSRPSLFKHRLRKLLQVGVLVQKQALGFSLCSLLFTTLRSESINLSSPASVVTSWSVGTSSVHARGSRARTKLSRLTSHVSRLTKGLALHMGNRTSLPPFGWIRRGNNYTSKIQDVHQCVTAWHAWNHGCCHRLPLQRRPLLCAAASSLSRCMQACLSLVASLTSR